MISSPETEQFIWKNIEVKQKISKVKKVHKLTYEK